MTTQALQRFVDDELMRAPMVMDVAMQSVFEALQKGPAIVGAAERQVAGEVILRLGAHRATIVAAYLKSLREQASAELAGQRAAAATQGRRAQELSLVEDEEVAIDVVTSHAIESIKSVAEAELRELVSFTSALANDMGVARDHNPLRAEAQARALWAASQALPLGRAHQLAFMRMVAMPFAQALRKAYAAACARLEDQGIEPAAYRTLILPRGPRRERAAIGDVDYAHRSMNDRIEAASPFSSTALRPDMTPAAPQVPHSAPPANSPRAQAQPLQTAHQAAQQAAHPAAFDATYAVTGDAQVADFVAQLFAAMRADRRLVPEVQAPLLRLQPCATAAALLDPRMLEQHGHPFWRFIDLFAHEALIRPGADGSARELLLRFVGKLIDQLAQEALHSEALYTWAIERLDRFVAKRLAERLSAIEDLVAKMQALDDRVSHSDGPVSTLHGAMDVEHLETVPADLMENHLQSEPPDRAMTSARWLLERRSGDWLRLFRKGHWGHAQLLWPGDRGEIFLFADGDDDLPWAIRRSAILVLRDAKLAHMAWPRSLIADATRHVLRRGPAR